MHPWAIAMFRRSSACLALLSLLIGLPAGAAVPGHVAVEGALLSAGGGPAADGTYQVTFAIYKDSLTAATLWSENAAVAVKGGIFAYVLGGKTPLKPDTLANVDQAWLGIKIDPDPELPRQLLHSVAYALRAGLAEGLECSGCVTAGQLAGDALKPYAKTSDLAKVATSGAYPDLTGTPDLAQYAKLAVLANVALSGAYGDLAGAPNLAVYAKTAGLAKVATSGAYADLSGLPVLAPVAISGVYADLAQKPTLPLLGTACGTGLALRGLKADGTYDCIAAASGPVEAKNLPADGIDEVSNGLIANQFVDSIGSSKVPIAILDNNPDGLSDVVDFPDIGLAQKLTIAVDIANSDISTLKVTVKDPDGITYVLYDKGATGGTLVTAYPDPTKAVSGDLTTWVGKNPKGKWTLSVFDTGFLTNTTDGKINKWSIDIQTLSNQKIQVKGNLMAAGSVQIGVDEAPCTPAKAGAIRWTGKVFQGCNGSAWIGLQGNDGSSQASSALDCKALKNAVASAADGVYWIDPNGGTTADAFQAYCDMTTDGGGWTFFAHVNDNYVGGQLFTTNTGTYRTDRADDNTTYSKAGNILPLLSHTQMMVTLDNANPQTAKSASKIVFYQYGIGSAGFNTGPVPCAGLSNGFSYRTAMSGAFTAGGVTNSCDSGSWYTRTAGNAAYLILFNNGSGYANYWGSGMGGNDSWNHDGFWYVR